MGDKVKQIPRIITLDIMRGYFLIAIIIDHIRFFPNGIDWISAQGGLFVTAAEGFFYISGLVLGIVRGANMFNTPMKKVTPLLLSRAAKLYITSLILVLIFTFLGWFVYGSYTGLKPGLIPIDTPWWYVLYQIITLQYFYGWADYLRLYAVFIAASPLVVWLLRRGKWHIALASSLVLWCFFPTDPTLPGVLQEQLQVVSWQLLFFLGLFTGFYWRQLQDWWHSLQLYTKQIIIRTMLTLTTITLTFNVLLLLSTQGYDFTALGLNAGLQERLYILFFDKERLPLTRIALALLWFWAAFYLVRRYEPVIKKWFGWLLIRFGENSLYVYILHAFAVFLIDLYFVSGPLWFNFIITAGTITLIRLCLHFNVLTKIIPR